MDRLILAHGFSMRIGSGIRSIVLWVVICNPPFVEVNVKVE